MIDDEADFGDITDAPAQVSATAKFRPKGRGKPRKPSAPSRPITPHPTVKATDEKARTVSQDILSHELTVNQEAPSSTFLGGETVGDVTASVGILDAPSEDVSTVSEGPVTNPDVALDSATGDVPAVDKVSHNEVATHQENLVISDTQASSTRSSGKTIDDLVDFGGLSDTHAEEERVAKIKPKIKVKLNKGASKSRKTNQEVIDSAVDVVSQNKQDGNNQIGCNDEQLQAPEQKDQVHISDSQASLRTDGNIVEELDNLDNILEEPDQKEPAGKLQPKLRPKPGKTKSRVLGTSDNVASSTPKAGAFASDVVSQDTKDDSRGEGYKVAMCQEPRDQEEADTVPDSGLAQDISGSVDLGFQDNLIYPNTDATLPTIGEPSAEATAEFQPYVRRKKSKRKSVSFILPDSSEGLSPTDASSEMRSTSHYCNDIGTDEDLNNFPQQTAQKHSITEEQHPNHPENTDMESQYDEMEPSDHAVAEQQPKLDGGKTELPMKLRSRKKLPKNGIPDDTFDEEVEPSAAEQDNDSADEYTAGGKQKTRRKSSEKDIDKETSRRSKRTSKDSSVEEAQKQKLQKTKSEASSRGQKRALKNTSTEQPEKKLTHRIRQKRTQEVKTLLEKPDHEIDRMKLSVMHLRLLQEAREHIKSKTNSSGPSSSNQSSSRFGDTDDTDFFGDKELEDDDNDRTENHVVENATKLNYHSYMDRRTRAKWSKSDTDLFYQGLQQFGSDFAMIQQLFPDKTRDQVRQKYKTEDKKHPMQVHDAMLHRSKDNLHLKQVIKQLNIEDVETEINDTHKQEGASNEGDTGHEDAFDDFIDEDEENGSNWSDRERGTHISEDKEGENVSANDDADLDVFDWY